MAKKDLTLKEIRAELRTAEKEVIAILKKIEAMTNCAVDRIDVYHNDDEKLEVEISLNY